MYYLRSVSGFFGAVLCIFALITCGDKKSDEAYENLDLKTRTRLKQYVHEGLRLYKKHCQNCHQENGEGLASLYPPLKKADYFVEDIPRAVCIMKNGQQGEIMVNGKTYNQPMPGNVRLTNLEIAEITTYLLYSMNDSVKIVTMHDVAKYLENCGKSVVKGQGQLKGQW